MTKAVARIEKAIAFKEVIGIFGDYDADGITGTAQLVRFFRRHGIEPVTHLPHRAKEGYGMKKASIDALKKKGVSLLLTVDTGISAHEEILHAMKLGMDVIVTDHHRVQKGRPAAFAVIHPLIPSPFPNQHLSGSGVAFMLIRALEKGQQWDGIDIDIALATIGTVGDLVPLTGENRILVLHGLRCMASLSPCPLKAFIDAVRRDSPLTAGDVAFKIVPRINAAGRMSHPDIALRALLEGGDALKDLHSLNSDRQVFVEDLHASLLGNISDKAFIVVASENVTPGTAGLLASRFTEAEGKPSLVAAIMGDLAVASLRSPEGIDVTTCLSHPSVSPLLLTYGGHAQAAGSTFKTSNLPALEQALQSALLAQGINPADLGPSLGIDMELPQDKANLDLAKRLAGLEPFGSGNEEPVFLLRNQMLTDLRTVGADDNHLQCRIGAVKGIGFRLGSLIDQLDTPVDLACRISVNAWNGRESVQLVVEDIRRSGQ